MHLFKQRVPKKDWLMTIVFFLICLIHNVLFNMKDALMVTTKGAGAEAIPFIQLWLLLPITIAAAAWIRSLFLRKGVEKAFYRVFMFFMIFFVVFAFFLYPFGDIIQPHQLAEEWAVALPQGFKGAIITVRFWTLSLLFIVGELWTSLITAVLFWAIANEITLLNNAQNSYSLIRLGGACGAIFGGLTPLMIGWIPSNLTVYSLLAIIIILCTITLILVRHLIKHMLDKDVATRLRKAVIIVSDSSKTQLRNITRSPYLLCLMVMVFGYNLSMNLFELVWKTQLQEVYPSFTSYNMFLGHSSTACGIITILFTLVTPWIINNFGWSRAAFVSPLLQLVCIGSFFGVLLFGHWLPWDSTTVANVAIILGAIQYSAGRATKHSIFDVTKDMAFIPLDSDVKACGKPAVDGLGSTGGRSAAAVVHQTILFSLGSIGAGIPIVSLLVVATLFVWLEATQSLSVRFRGLVAQKAT